MVVNFWNINDTPAGMFTREHLVAFCICWCVILLFLYSTRKWQWKKVLTLTRIYAIIITFLEIIKISYSFSIGHNWIDAWFPLSFCSLFIYSLWLAGFTKEKWQNLGISFISIGALTGGFWFLIFPTTSLMNFPITHFLCLYSLLFHSSMIGFSILYLKTCPISYDWSLAKSYLFLLGCAVIFSVTLNFLTNSNLMILREPYNIPISLVQQIAASFPWLYTGIAVILYAFVPILSTSFLTHFLSKR